MSDFVVCPKCGKVNLFNNHRCPPMFLCKTADDDTPFEDIVERAVYARDEIQAAENYADQWLREASDGDLVLTVEVCNYPQMDTITAVEVHGELVLECTGHVQSTVPYSAFQDVDPLEE